MKKAIKLFVAIVVSIGAIHVNARETALKVNMVGKKKFRIEVMDVHGATTSYIKDDLGQILYKSRSKGNRLRLFFDLSHLKSGNYSLLIEDDYKVQTLPVIVKKEGIEIKKDRLRKTFFPRLVKNDENVLVKLISDENNDLFIDIRTQDGKVLILDKLEGQPGLIGKNYRFTPGDYAVTITSDHFVKTSYFTVK
ncbi:MAG: hypothetical protein AAF620_17980 [Bacteroidota bacterium]